MPSKLNIFIFAMMLCSLLHSNYLQPTHFYMLALCLCLTFILIQFHCNLSAFAFTVFITKKKKKSRKELPYIFMIIVDNYYNKSVNIIFHIHLQSMNIHYHMTAWHYWPIQLPFDFGTAGYKICFLHFFKVFFFLVVFL